MKAHQTDDRRRPRSGTVAAPGAGEGVGRAHAGPPCPHYPDCVGCALIGTPYGAQLLRKQGELAEALRAYPRLASVGVPAVVGSASAFGYRNQAKLVARTTRAGFLLGIYRPGTHRVVDIRRCPVHHPLIAPVLEAVANVVERYALPVYDEDSRSGVLRYVIVRVSAWMRATQIVLVTHGRHFAHKREVVQALRRVRSVVSIVQNINSEPGNAIFGSEYVALTRETALIERLGFLKLKTHAGAFVQANLGVARKLYEHARAWAAPRDEDTVVDLYCGVGALTFYLAAQAKFVVGIEASPIAVADAKENIRVNGFHNVRFHCGDAAETLAVLMPRLPRVDVVTLNPPRKGADVSTREAIVRCAPRRVVYVSCNPATLAGDLDWFAAHGYRTAAVRPFDLLPQTDHVETVALLERRGGEAE